MLVSLPSRTAIANTSRRWTRPGRRSAGDLRLSVRDRGWISRGLLVSLLKQLIGRGVYEMDSTTSRTINQSIASVGFQRLIVVEALLDVETSVRAAVKEARHNKIGNGGGVQVRNESYLPHPGIFCAADIDRDQIVDRTT